MRQKTEYLVDVTRIYFRLDGSTVTFQELARLLNAEGFRTEYGTTYSYTNPRGVAKLVTSAYYRLVNEGRIEDADAVALTFTNHRGEYAYS